MADNETSESEVLFEEIKRQSKKRGEHHQERIQILVALSLFAGYITAFFNDLFANFALNIAATILASTTSVFLLYKLILNSHLANGDLMTSDKIDRIFSTLYLISVVGFGFVAIFIVGAEQLSISVQDISTQTVSTILSAAMIPTMLTIFVYIGRKQIQNLHHQEEQLRENVPAALELLETGDIVNSQKRKSLVERLEALLDKDREELPDWFASMMIVMQPEGLVSLTASNRLRILNITDRIARRDKHGIHKKAT